MVNVTYFTTILKNKYVLRVAEYKSGSDAADTLGPPCKPCMVDLHTSFQLEKNKPCPLGTTIPWVCATIKTIFSQIKSWR